MAELLLALVVGVLIGAVGLDQYLLRRKRRELPATTGTRRALGP